MFRIHTGRTAAIIALLSTAALPQTVFAASYLDAVKTGIKTAYTTSLIDIAQEENGLTTRTLDWRQPSLELYFDLPPAERSSEIILTLSADPLTRVAPNTPLLVQFNNGAPIPVRTNGKGFEARLSMDAGQSRSKRNQIRITYPAPDGTSCVTPAHGAWSIDLAESKLRIAGRAKSRHMSLSEVSDFLEQPALTPQTVGVIASGPHRTDMQALAAQAIALRTPDVPKFSITPKNTDFNVVMVKRSRLFYMTDDPMILNSKGPRIFSPRSRPTELIFTADTDAEILEMLEVFATRDLPNTRRSISSLGELDMQGRLDRNMRTVEGKTRLLDLTNISAAGLSNAQTYKFNVEEPAAMGGEILLRLSTPKEEIDENSRLRVVLNGTTLGAAKLNKKRKSVVFDIQPGDLNATSNVLTLIPDVQATAGFTCPLNNGHVSSGYSVGYGSLLNLKKTIKTPVTELSQLTSSGGIFSKTESYIALPKQTRDYQAALRVLGRMAKSTGHGLTSADYSRKPMTAKDKHLLIIGPSDMLNGHLAGAPKALRDALSGRATTGDNLLQATYGQSASLGFGDAAAQYAAALSSSRRVRQGGIAALYSGGNGKLTGVISAAPGSSFIKSSQSLIEPSHWNALKGGVARWTSSSVVMAQTAQSDAGIKKPKVEPVLKRPELGIYALDNLDLHWPKLSWPEFEAPQVSIPKISKPKLSWPKFKSGDDVTAPSGPTLEQQPTFVESETYKTVDVKSLGHTTKHAEILPRVKPVFKSRVKDPKKATAGLRGPYKFKLEPPKRSGALAGFQRETHVKWAETKRWFKAKTQNVSNAKVFDNAAKATDRLQDRTRPAGQTMKASLQDKIPGKGLVQIGDRHVSAYGLMLIMAFGLVLLLMSLARPTSRLGKRH